MTTTTVTKIYYFILTNNAEYYVQFTEANAIRRQQYLEYKKGRVAWIVTRSFERYSEKGIAATAIDRIINTATLSPAASAAFTTVTKKKVNSANSTHCRKGHLFTDKNSSFFYQRGTGESSDRLYKCRRCLTCLSIYKVDYKAKRGLSKKERNACKHGHPYIPGNYLITYSSSSGTMYRRCLVCAREKSRKWMLENRAKRKKLLSEGKTLSLEETKQREEIA